MVTNQFGPIMMLGADNHIPKLQNKLFFGLFNARKSPSIVPTAECDGYFFDLVSGRGMVLPYFQTGITSDLPHRAQKLILIPENMDGRLNLCQALEYHAMIDGKTVTIWSHFIPGKLKPNLEKAFDEFFSFFPDTNYSLNFGE